MLKEGERQYAGGRGKTVCWKKGKDTMLEEGERHMLE
jgi:hypothetical protein